MTMPENDHDTLSDDERWAALVTRDATANGKFIYAVKTTGIFCLPSCPSRLAKRHNILFFASPQLALESGFRACQRCHPEQPLLHIQSSSGLKAQPQHTALIVELCDFIIHADHVPSLAELSERAGLSSYYLHRLFKRITGLTPHAYAQANRQQRLRERLMREIKVTQAIYDAGYNSSSQFYKESKQVLGMSPAQYRAGGKNTNIYFAVGECSLGSVLVAQSQQGICAIALGDDPSVLLTELQQQFSTATLIGGDANYEATVARVIGFIEKPNAPFDLPLDIRGTLFQQRVWQALQHIRPGETVSYSELAQQIGAPSAVRAVASACAANVLAVAIPCHRVVRMNGDLSGYRWGIERKRLLLEVERSL